MVRKGRLQIVLVPFPLQGHFSPMLQLGTILHSRGFSIIIAHSKYSTPNPSNHPPDFVFLPLMDNIPPAKVMDDVIVSTRRLNESCKPRFQDYLFQTTKRSHQQDKPDANHRQIACIIHDRFMYFAQEVAQLFKLPSIVMYTDSASAVLASTSLARLHTRGRLLIVKEEDSTLDNSVPELQNLRFKDLPIFQNRNLILDVMLQMVAFSFRRPQAVIWNTFDHLDHSALEQLQQHQLYHQVPFFAIGPFHKIGQTLSTSLKIEDRSCFSWLDKQAKNSVVYVSLGSLAVMDDREVTEMAWGLANSNQPFLWVVRPGSVLGSEWTELLPERFKETVGERGCIVNWAPQKEVLAHDAVGGFWSHCGWNSSLESICEGVPMICWPRFSDQPVNARYLSYVWGVGLEVEHELERGGIERAIKRLMVEEEGLEIRQRAAELKEKVEAAVKEGGSSWNSLNDLVEYILSFKHLVAAKPEIQVPV